MSLDGYIAGPQGEADWIEIDPAVDVAAFFREFYAQFDIALMGRKTYELVGGPLEGISYIRVLANAVASRLSRRDRPCRNGIEEVRRLRSQEGRDIWLFGGGGLLVTRCGSPGGQGRTWSDAGVARRRNPGDVRDAPTGKAKLLETEQSAVGGLSLKYKWTTPTNSASVPTLPNKRTPPPGQ